MILNRFNRMFRSRNAFSRVFDSSRKRGGCGRKYANLLKIDMGAEHQVASKESLDGQ